MITFVTGKPGGGKSYYALRLIFDEFVNGGRLITTNIALVLPNFRELFLQRYLSVAQGIIHKEVDARLVDKFLDFPAKWRAVVCRHVYKSALNRALDTRWNVNRRIRILTEAEVPAFFLHRGHGVDIPPITQAEERLGRCPQIRELRPVDEPGVFYVIDEAHQFFNTRTWASNSLSAFSYLAKHRHLNDEIVFISQSPEQVDKQLKLQVQYWIYVLNTGMDLWGRGFRGRENHIKAHWYTEEPPHKMAILARLQAVKVETLEIEVSKPGQLRLGDCYLTLQFGTPTVGGRIGAETKRKRIGRPAWLIAIPVVGVVAVVWAVPYILEHSISAALGGINKGLTKGLGGNDTSSAVSTVSSVSSVPTLWSVRTVGLCRSVSCLSVCVRAVAPDGRPLAPAQWYDLPPDADYQRDSLNFSALGRIWRLRYNPDFDYDRRHASGSVVQQPLPGAGVQPLRPL